MALHDEVAAAFSLEDKVAVVTGAGSGIGREIARVLALVGAGVIATDIRPEAVEVTCEAIRSAGGQAVSKSLDVASRESTEALADAVVTDHGQLDIWVNCAGISPLHSILETDPDVAERTVAVNMLGTYWGCMAAGRVMGTRGGSIINISSAGGAKPVPNLAIYGMTKAAVNSLTWTAAAEFGSMGIRVNAIAPGWIETPAMDVLFRDEAGNIDPNRRDAMHAQMMASSPLGRLGSVTDIAYALVYLASDAGSFITGQVLRVNGGESM